MPEEFPKTVAAVRRADGSQWEIADALLAEVGEPTDGSKHDGSREKIEACAVELESLGFSYALDTLRKFRDTAHRFPAGRRRPAVSFAAHVDAREPEILEEAVKKSTSGKPTCKEVRELRASKKPAPSRKEVVESASIEAITNLREMEELADAIIERLPDVHPDGEILRDFLKITDNVSRKLGEIGTALVGIGDVMPSEVIHA